jgi:hypothetical protein
MLLQPLLIHSQKAMTKKQFVKDSIRITRVKLVRPQFKFDSRTILSNGQRLNVSGLDAGVLLKEKLRVTLGYYRLNNNKFNNTEKPIGDDIYDMNYKSVYGTLNLEFNYLNRRYFSLGMPLEIGIGTNYTDYISRADGSSINKSKGVHALSYFGLSGTFKPIRWAGLKISAGYRKDLFNQVKEVNLDGIYTSLGLTIDFREIIKDVRMYKLKKKYKKGFNSVGTAVDLIID